MRTVLLGDLEKYILSSLLAHKEGKATIKDINAHIYTKLDKNLSMSALYSSLTRLEDKYYVKVTKNKEDNRLRIFHITDEGRKALISSLETIIKIYPFTISGY